MYPWKRQPSDGVVYADFTQVLKPLPPPPEGMTWVKRRVVVEAAAGGGGQQEAQDPEQGQEQEQQDGGANVGEAEVAEVADAGTAAAAASAAMAASAARFVWELVERPARPEGWEEPLVVLEAEEEPLPEFLEHTVLPTDTLAGLRLRYKITAAELRRHNEFAGEAFQMLPTIRIPIHQGREEHIKKHKQVRTFYRMLDWLIDRLTLGVHHVM